MTHRRTHIRTLRHALVASLALACCVAFAGGATAAEKSGSDSVGFGVSPLRIDSETGAGKTASYTITISNTDTSATKFTFTKEDYSGDKDDPGATPVLLGGKFDSPISGYDWLEVPDPVTVAPGDSKAVKVNVKVPAGATGPHYAALMVNGEARGAGQLVATSRIGVLFVMNAGGAPPPELVITQVKEVGPNKTITKYINTGGNQTTTTTGTLTEDPKGPGKPRRIKGVCTQEVLPGAAGQCEFTTGGGGDGTTVGDGGSGGGILDVGPTERSVDIVGTDSEGEGTSAKSELPTEWAGTWTSLLLPLVGVALFVLYFLFLRRRRKRGDDDEDPGVAWAGPGLS